ncbi:DUF4349 domain-containing protein [Chryseobacterium pennipullorum]|uniref:DUF4349 domain-containing protein n=1 Tax=Chryseobacterium pennipullorum TaxID=2258963 RepID=A0A3D9AYM9_9FLAO|nr:DUF4349 domain-containing protein [Chryseobacterium pennipullorum]REC46448.1 DUF4349 domain-containing protein [Chryseobacterium pennipullorum]
MKNIVLALSCLLLIHCNKSGVAEHSVKADLFEVISEDEPISPVAPPNAVSEKLAPDKGYETLSSVSKKTDTLSKKIIKNGDMKIQVGDIKKSQSQVNAILKSNNAYIQKEDFQNTDRSENLNLTVRVPHKNFDVLVNSFSDGVGSVLSKNISSDDMTEEYTDISIKLANKKIYLEKYRDMLKSASTTKDMLEIQEKIRGLEDEMDIAEGRLRFIDDRVNYSTLYISLYKEKVRSSATSKIGFGSRFIDSLTEGWNFFVGFLLGVVSLWPFFLLVPVVIFLWKKWKSRKAKP